MSEAFICLFVDSCRSQWRHPREVKGETDGQGLQRAGLGRASPLRAGPSHCPLPAASESTWLSEAFAHTVECDMIFFNQKFKTQE